MMSMIMLSRSSRKLFHIFIYTFPLTSTHAQQVGCPDAILANRAKQLLANVRELNLDYSVYGDCRTAGRRLNYLLKPIPDGSTSQQVYQIGSFKRNSQNDVDEYDYFCLDSNNPCESANSGTTTVQSQQQCIRPSSQSKVTTLDFSLFIHPKHYLTLKDRWALANYEWSNRLATILGIGLEDIEVVSLFTPHNTQITPTSFLVEREGLSRRALEGEDWKEVGKIQESDNEWESGAGAKNDKLSESESDSQKSQQQSSRFLRGSKSQAVWESKLNKQQRQVQESTDNEMDSLLDVIEGELKQDRKPEQTPNSETELAKSETISRQESKTSWHGPKLPTKLIDSTANSDRVRKGFKLPLNDNLVKSETVTGTTKFTQYTQQGKESTFSATQKSSTTTSTSSEVTTQIVLTTTSPPLMSSKLKPRALQTAQRRITVSFHVETKRDLHQDCVELTGADFTQLLGLDETDYIDSPQLITWINAGSSLESYTRILHYQSSGTEYYPIHNAWIFSFEKLPSISEGWNPDVLLESSYLTCNQAIQSLRWPMALKCTHDRSDSTAGSTGNPTVLTNVVEFQFSYKTKVDIGLISKVSLYLKKELCFEIFGDKQDSTMYRMYTAKADTNGVSVTNIVDGNPQSEAYFEASVLMNAIVAAPGWETYPALQAQQSIQGFCCNAGGGIKLRDQMYQVIADGFAEGDADDGTPSEFSDFGSYLDKQNFIDVFVTSPTIRYGVPMEGLVGVCDENAPASCTTDAPIESAPIGTGNQIYTGPTTPSPFEQICQQITTGANGISVHCRCAASGCQWSSAVGCVLSGFPVNCIQCPTQSACANSECASASDACSCAAIPLPAVCGWDGNLGKCTNAITTGVSCDHCSSELANPKCRPPSVTAVTPSHQQEVKGLIISYQFLFSERIYISSFAEVGWASVECTNSSLPRKDIVSLHRIDKERLFFDNVQLPIHENPNSWTRTCSLRLLPDAIIDNVDRKFNGIADHQLVVLDEIPPSMTQIVPKTGGQVTNSALEILLIFNENVMINQNNVQLPWVRRKGSLNSDSNNPANLDNRIILSTSYISVRNSESIPDSAVPDSGGSGTVVAISLTKILAGVQRDTEHVLVIPHGFIMDVQGNNPFVGIPCTAGGTAIVNQQGFNCLGSPMDDYTFYIPNNAWLAAFQASGGDSNYSQGMGSGSDDDSASSGGISGETIMRIVMFIGVGLGLLLIGFLIGYLAKQYVAYRARNAYLTNKDNDAFWSRQRSELQQKQKSIASRRSQSSGSNGNGSSINLGIWTKDIAPESDDQNDNISGSANVSENVSENPSEYIGNSPNPSKERFKGLRQYGTAAQAAVRMQQQSGQKRGSQYLDPKAGPSVAERRASLREKEKERLASQLDEEPSGSYRVKRNATNDYGTGNESDPSGGSKQKAAGIYNNIPGSKEQPTSGNNINSSYNINSSKKRQSQPETATEKLERERKEKQQAYQEREKQREKARRTQERHDKKVMKEEIKPELPAHSSTNQEAAKLTKDIEKQLRDNQNASVDDKKKIMRDLQLKYHPDKNADPLAKTIFQYVQGAKPWFHQEQEQGSGGKEGG